MRYFIETRADGLPWTREGCNGRAGGTWVAYASREAAEDALERLKSQDDPMWRTAEYRLVGDAKAPRSRTAAFKMLHEEGAGMLADSVVLQGGQLANSRLPALCRLILAGHQVTTDPGDLHSLLVDGFGIDWQTLDHRTTEEISKHVTIRLKR